MNYQKHYDALMNKGKNRKLEGYCESHHIIPRCQGGNNSPDNLVELTPEEHYVAHQLLVKLNPKSKKLIFAAIAMSNGIGKRNNKLYGWLKRRMATAQSRARKGKKLSAATIAKREATRKARGILNPSVGRASTKGIARTKKVKAKISKTLKGHGFTETSKKKMSETAKNRTPFSCLSCHQEFRHARHFAACKGN